MDKTRIFLKIFNVWIVLNDNVWITHGKSMDAISKFLFHATTSYMSTETGSSVSFFSPKTGWAESGSCSHYPHPRFIGRGTRFVPRK